LEESVFEPSILIHDPFLILKAQKVKVLRHLITQTKKIKTEISKLNRYLEIFDPFSHLNLD
jgi:hypothetical protein